MIYQPSDDSYLLAEQVSLLCKNKSFLDMGSGSGIQSKTALENNVKSVLAVDINDEVISHLSKLNIPNIKSDLFNNLQKNTKFDLIAFNPPYLPKDSREPSDSKLATTGGKKGDEIILRFLKQAVNYLNPEGKILLVISSLTPLNNIISSLNNFGLSHKVLSSKKLFMEELQVWEIKKN